MTDDGHMTDDLAGYLDALRRDDCFRVDAVLKASPSEETQRVYFQGANGAEQGPYIRKCIDRDAGIGRAYLELFRARRAGRRFRYLPAVYDCHEAGGRLVVVMEHAAGRTLRETVGATSPQDRPGLARRVFPALCAAVGELHGAFPQPIVHRDLTPSNIVCPEADPAALTVIDLGIARTWRPDAVEDTAYFGTRPYAPPEQFGFGQTDVRTDVYALGLVLFFCLTGRDATRADRAAGFAAAGVPSGLRAVVERAAALDPADRYADVRALAAAFGAAEAEGGDGGHAGAGEGEDGGLPAARRARLAPVRPDGPDAPADPGPPAPWGLLARLPVPAWLGRAWNAAVLAAYAFVLAGCVQAVVCPAPANAGWPLWFLVYSYGVFLAPLFGLLAWALLDKRRLRTRFPRLAPRGPLVRRALRWGLFAALDIAFYLVVGLGGSALGLIAEL